MSYPRSEWRQRPTEDPLQPALERLTRFLNGNVPGREGEWAADVSRALADVEQALHRHTAGAEQADGLLSEVDLTRPTLVRRVAELRQEHSDLLEEVRQFHNDLANAVQAFLPPPAGTVNSLPEPRGSEAVPDFGALRQRGERLVAALEHHREEETTLTLESVTTDIGVGD